MDLRLEVGIWSESGDHGRPHQALSELEVLGVRSNDYKCWPPGRGRYSGSSLPHPVYGRKERASRLFVLAPGTH